MSQTIWISRVDLVRLQRLLVAERVGARYPILARRRRLSEDNLACLDALAAKLARAHLAGPTRLPPDVVTMNSRARLRDAATDLTVELALVFPNRADVDAGRLSVLTPLGVALLGSREREEIAWRTAGVETSLIVDRVLYQPEAAADFHL